MKVFITILTLSFVLVCFSVTSQGGPPIFPFGGGGEEPCGVPFDPCPIPLDGGASILLAAGLAYGGKKVQDRKKSGLSK